MSEKSLPAPVESGQNRTKAYKNGHRGPLFELPSPSRDREAGDQEEPALKPSQEQALSALLTCPTVRAAARQVGVHDRTIRRWLQDDKQFQKRLRQLRNEALGQASTHLQQGATQAVRAMYDLIESDQLIETGRATLIRTALDFAFRSGAYGDLADRIADLEKVAPDEKK